MGWRPKLLKKVINIFCIPVLSPLGGMETRDQSFRSVGSYKDLTICSKPTAWDGYIFVALKLLVRKFSSEPTVWDGDMRGREIFLPYNTLF